MPRPKCAQKTPRKLSGPVFGAARGGVGVLQGSDACSDVLQVTWDNDQSVGTWSLIPYVYLACHWLAMSHCCANPLIYCWMNSRFRQGFRQALGRLCCGRWGMAMGPMGLQNVGGTLSMARGNTLTSYVSVRRHKSQAAIPLVRTALTNGHNQQQQQQQQQQDNGNGNGKLINGYRDQQF